MTDRRPLDILDSPVRPGISVVEASAGTGKTYSLMGLALRLLLDDGETGTPYVQDIGRLLVVTFTVAATDELTSRIRETLRKAIRVFEGEPTDDPLLGGLARRFGRAGLPRLRQALKGFDRAAICTIHGFCKRTLEQAAFESGLPFEMEFLHDHGLLLERAARDVWRRHVAPSTTLAELTVGMKWTVDDMLAVYDKAHRVPGTRILPEAAPLEDVLGRFGDAVGRLTAAWDRAEMERLLASLDFKKSDYTQPDAIGEALDGMDALAAGRLAAGLGALGFFDAATMQEKLKKGQQLPEIDLFEAIDRLRRGVDEVQLSLTHTFVDDVHRRFAAARQQDHLLTFDDLLNRLRTALHDPTLGLALARSVHARYDVALIDEFQDTDPVQFDIFRRIFAQGQPARPLFFIGDPKQSIYSFRGADVFTYRAARGQAGDTVYTLDTNWRSETSMVQAVNLVFGSAHQPFLYPWIEFEPVAAAGLPDAEGLTDSVGGSLHWWYFPSSQTTAKGQVKAMTSGRASELVLDRLTREVVRLLSSGDTRIGARPVAPADIAVLVRTNGQAAAVSEALRGAGVPSVIARTGDIANSPEMDQLLTILAAVESPGHAGKLAAALATEPLGWTAPEIHAAQRDPTRWNDLVDEFEGYRRQWNDESRGFMGMVQSLTAAHDVRSRLLGYVDGERRLTNYLHAAELLHEAVETDHLRPRGVFDWVDRIRDKRTADDPERRELRLESDADAVQIATVHRSKGLEYGIVFCPFLWCAKCADLRPPMLVRDEDGAVLYLDGRAPAEADLRKEDDRLAEDLRLVYVALTRAVHRAYVAWGHLGNNARHGKAAQSALGYLLHQGKADPTMGELQWPRHVMGRLDGAMATWGDDLARLAEKSQGLMTVNVFDGPSEDPPPWWFDAESGQRQLTPSRFPEGAGERLKPWRSASFSSLTRTLSTVHGRRGQPPASVDPIFAFGWAPSWRGRANITGSCMHSIIEHVDFVQVDSVQVDSEPTRRMVERTLSAFRLNAPQAHQVELDPTETVLAMLERLTSTEIPGTSLKLGGVDPSRRLDELGFQLPLSQFDTARLASLFERAGGIAKRYAERLKLLERDHLRGYLTGFVDLVVEHRGACYVLDWKFSHLGYEPACYDREAVAQAMIDHDYVLQYHLYVLALHRYLKTRLPDYDYDRHVGGAVYAFLRGIDGTPEHGWYVDLKPPRRLIERLDRLCGEATP